MKTYRNSVFDAQATASLFEFLAERADYFRARSEEYAERVKKEIESGDGNGSYYADNSAEYAALSTAFDRLLAKLAK